MNGIDVVTGLVSDGAQRPSHRRRKEFLAGLYADQAVQASRAAEYHELQTWAERTQGNLGAVRQHEEQAGILRRQARELARAGAELRGRPSE